MCEKTQMIGRLEEVIGFGIQGAPVKSIPLQSLADNSSTVEVNFVIFCRSIERLYPHTFAELHFAMANNEKDTVN